MYKTNKSNYEEDKGKKLFRLIFVGIGKKCYKTELSQHNLNFGFSKTD